MTTEDDIDPFDDEATGEYEPEGYVVPAPPAATARRGRAAARLPTRAALRAEGQLRRRYLDRSLRRRG